VLHASSDLSTEGQNLLCMISLFSTELS